MPTAESSASTLARLSFWVSPERMAEFEAAYEARLTPILKKAGLVESSIPGRATMEGVFSRLFAVETPAQVAVREQALRKDPAWQEALRCLGPAFGAAGSNGSLRPHLGYYRGPAGVGRTVEAGDGFRQGLWQTFSVRDGLPTPIGISLVQDRSGCLWIGTWSGGVTRYNGAEFTTFTTEDGLVSNQVVAVREDRAGNLWFAAGYRSRGGVSRYDGEEFVTFTTEDGLAMDEVSTILEDREGYLWFGTYGGGVSRYDGEKFVTFTTEDGLAHNIARPLLQDQEGYLWFGSFGGGVSRYDGEEFVTFTTRDGLAGNWVRDILQDREGQLWFGCGYWKTEDGGVSRYDGEKFTTFTTKDGLAHNWVYTLLEDREGCLWFGTHGGGVSRYDGTRFTTFTSDDGLAHDKIYSLLEDREGQLWCGTNGGGISRYDGLILTDFTTQEDWKSSNRAMGLREDRKGQLVGYGERYRDRFWYGLKGGGVSLCDGEQWITFTTADGLPSNKVSCLGEDRTGNLWMGTAGGGVSRYDGEQWTTFTTADGLPKNEVVCLKGDGAGNLWIGTVGGGICRYDGERFTTFTTADGLPSNWVVRLWKDRTGHLWIGTDGEGVCRYDRERFTTFTTADGLPSNWVQAFLEDRAGNLWMGTAGGGLSRYDGEGFTTFTTAEGLSSNWVQVLLEDRAGNLWMGTDGGGVCRYDGERFTIFTTADGLPSNEVLYLREDQEGHLWMGTNGGGVCQYDGLVFQTLSRKDGLGHDSVEGIRPDRRGHIWIFTVPGSLIRYRPSRIPPSIRLIDVTADLRYGPVQDIQVFASQKLLAFEFQGRSLTTRPDRMVYVYRLEGYDPAWKPSYARRVEYQDLPLGEYIFQVKAVDRDLNYSEPIAVRVSVVPDPLREALTEVLSRGGATDEFLGESAALRWVQRQFKEVAPTDLTVLILGETGTGKGVAARTVHKLSPRRAGPFLQVNCGAIPAGLVESELFGHEKGAFTGATSRKLGKVELAAGGTLFLDEIGDLALEAQVKLLRVLEEGSFERVGGTQTLQAEVRVIAASNRDLRQMTRDGRFREDLYFRLQAFPVRLPPLRERREDIQILAVFFAERMAAHLNKTITQLDPAVLDLLVKYDWPGNVRELEHAIQRAVIVCAGQTIQVADIALEVEAVEEVPARERVTLEENERRYLRQVLEQSGWVICGPGGAATVLGVPESTLRYRMKKLGLKRSPR